MARRSLSFARPTVRFALLAALVADLAGCSTEQLAPVLPQAATRRLTPTDALEELLAEGPVNFGQITDTIYRGGQPDAADLARMRALGVDTIINLRRENRSLRRRERRTAEALGMRVLEFPFYGVFGADDEFLGEILRQATDPDNGTVYVHCKNGRDRTSLVIALYRVLYQGWKAEEAWNYEVLAFGHQPTRFYRQIGTTFRRTIDELEVQPGLPDAPAAEVRPGSGPSALERPGRGAFTAKSGARANPAQNGG
jgi:protein tyrosine/serine phosphatase